MNTFILRQYFADETELNTIIGESYKVITRENDKHGRSFNESLAIYYKVPLHDRFPENLKEMANKTYGFIVYENGAKLYALIEGFKYYMMIGDGKTFANLSKKD